TSTPTLCLNSTSIPLRPPSPMPTPFPYTTLFRSNALTALLRVVDLGIDARRPLTQAQIDATAAWRARDEALATATARGEATRLRSEEHTSELQSRFDLVCRLLLAKKK